MSNADEICKYLKSPTSETVFYLGSFEERVTVYAQQVRALNLAWALSEVWTLANMRVAVVGGGACGLTAALGLLRRGAAVTVFERNEMILSRFAGNRQRYLHPHLYDWPRPGFGRRHAGLPLMNWSAATADEVVKQLRRVWAFETAGESQLTLLTDTAVTSVEEDGNVIRTHGASHSFDLIVLAVGVGTEPRRFDTPRYWENDVLSQDVSNIKRILVSGNGDGGLVDAIRASLLDFDHEQLTLQFLQTQAADAVANAVLSIEDRAEESDLSMSQAFSELSMGGLEVFMESRTRNSRHVTLNVSGALHRKGTMALNRLLVEALRRRRLAVWHDRLVDCKRETDEWIAQAASGEERRFDLAVFRWGPDSDLEPLIATRGVINRPRATDPTRDPRWDDSAFARKSRRTVDHATITPTGYDVVPINVGLGLESRGWWLNSNGVIVGWATQPDRHDHALFRWENADSPPEQVSVPGVGHTAGRCVNDRGDYVMSIQHAGGTQAIVVQSGRIDSLEMRSRDAIPYAINNDRIVVGCDLEEAGLYHHPCLWVGGRIRVLPDLGFGGVALQLNEAGDIVGEIRTSHNGPMAAARWRNSILAVFSTPAPFHSSRAFRINSRGDVAGYMMVNGGQSHYFRWSVDGSIALGLEGEAYGLTDDGWVACRAGSKGAFLEREGTVLWLDELARDEWRIKWPLCLNNELWMVGVASRRGIDEAVVMIPRY